MHPVFCNHRRRIVYKIEQLSKLTIQKTCYVFRQTLVFLIVFLIALYRNIFKRPATCRHSNQCKSPLKSIQTSEASLETSYKLIDSEAFEELQLSEIEEAQERELVESNSYFKYLYACTKELEDVETKSNDGKVDKHLDYKMEQCKLGKDYISDTKQQQVYARMLDRLNGLFENKNHRQ